MEPRTHGTDYELLVTPLVDAADSNAWRDALEILFLSSGLLELEDQIRLPVLISHAGSEEGVPAVLDLMNSRAKTDFLGIVRPLAQQFVPQIVVAVEEQTSTGQEPKPDQFVAGMVARFMGRTDDLQAAFMGHAASILQGTVSLSDGLVAATYAFLQERRSTVVNNAPHPGRYENMISTLKRLGLISPRLQASVCAQCRTTRLVVSGAPSYEDRCPKCGNVWSTLTLHVLEPGYSELKARNHDLSVFIAAYLRRKIREEAVLAEPVIFALARYDLPDGSHAEIDVHLPSNNFGIECKCYEDAQVPMTRHRAAGLSADLVQQSENYSRVGVKRLIIATNLRGSACAKLESQVRVRLPTGIKREPGMLLNGDITRLIKKLDELAKDVGRDLTAAATKGMLAAARKPPAQAVETTAKPARRVRSQSRPGG